MLALASTPGLETSNSTGGKECTEFLSLPIVVTSIGSFVVTWFFLVTEVPLFAWAQTFAKELIGTRLKKAPSPIMTGLGLDESM